MNIPMPNRTVVNLSTGEELHFDHATDPLYALAYGYYSEQDKLTWFFGEVYNGDEGLKQWRDPLHYRFGQRTISLGDWCLIEPDVAHYCEEISGQ
jgi:hypothetical protein